MLTLVPLTSNTSRVYPFQVLLPAEECGLPKDSNQRMAEIDVALRRHLAL
ncbi:hypothetical protein PV396_13890 [Streptomyces sp. ME02-8801-2C]|nr:hypothetical protein [Streptomyces sp. ME02-8801-2C]MDX3453030.1 hypothetical protein [Streptomyces sp. ME02-8801-2C]